MRDRPTKFNDTPTEADEWSDELERFDFEPSDLDTAMCAELADELSHFRREAEADYCFEERSLYWEEYIWEQVLWLALEQCCDEGVLLSDEQRELKLVGCPVEIRGDLEHFLRHCPPHVLHHLALRYWVMVRIDRARRTGSPDWRPADLRAPYRKAIEVLGRPDATSPDFVGSYSAPMPYGTANVEKPTDEHSAVEQAQSKQPSPQAIELAARILAKRAMRKDKENANRR